MPRQWTEEQKQALRNRLAKGRETAKRKREAKEAASKAEPETLGPAPIEDYEAALLGDIALADPGYIDTQEEHEVDIRADRRRRLTGDLPPDLAALITDEELEKIEREENEKALAAQKKQALADVRAIASAEARIEHGLIPADTLRSEAEKMRLAEKVKIRVNLPRGGGAVGLRSDGRLYRHGSTYDVTRAQFESLHYTVFRMWLDELRFRTLDQNERGRSAVDLISANPPQFEVLN